MTFKIIEEIMNKPEGNNNCLANHHHSLIQLKKKERRGMLRDRYIGTINQSLFLNSIVLISPK